MKGYKELHSWDEILVARDEEKLIITNIDQDKTFIWDNDGNEVRQQGSEFLICYLNRSTFPVLCRALRFWTKKEPLVYSGEGLVGYTGIHHYMILPGAPNKLRGKKVHALLTEIFEDE